MNVENSGGRLPLHYAASKGRLRIAEILISHGSKLNHKDKVSRLGLFPICVLPFIFCVAILAFYFHYEFFSDWMHPSTSSREHWQCGTMRVVD